LVCSSAEWRSIWPSDHPIAGGLDRGTTCHARLVSVARGNRELAIRDRSGSRSFSRIIFVAEDQSRCFLPSSTRQYGHRRFAGSQFARKFGSQQSLSRNKAAQATDPAMDRPRIVGGDRTLLDRHSFLHSLSQVNDSRQRHPLVIVSAPLFM